MLRSLLRLFLVLTALCAPVLAQRETDGTLPGSSFEISGQVRGSNAQKTVANVMVRLERFSGSVVDQIATDGTGKFRFSRLMPGQYVLTARVEGFAAKTPQIDISRAIPRQYVILQLQPEEALFKGTTPGVVDARVPEGAWKEFEKGQIALQSKNAKEAVTHLEKAIELSGDFFAAQMMLGVAHMELEQWDKAERALRRALEIRPKTSGALISLGEVYRRQKKYAEAEKSLVEGLRHDRTSWQGHYTLGRVYWEKNEVIKAAPHVGEAMKLKPDLPEAHLLAGNIFVRLGMTENALAAYEEYLRLAPGGEFARQSRENVAKLKARLKTGPAPPK